MGTTLFLFAGRAAFAGARVVAARGRRAQHPFQPPVWRSRRLQTEQVGAVVLPAHPSLWLT
eukprot:5665497-Pleurochrysis_carterae.AAC.1